MKPAQMSARVEPMDKRNDPEGEAGPLLETLLFGGAVFVALLAILTAVVLWVIYL